MVYQDIQPYLSAQSVDMFHDHLPAVALRQDLVSFGKTDCNKDYLQTRAFPGCFWSQRLSPTLPPLVSTGTVTRVTGAWRVGSGLGCRNLPAME